MGRTCVVVFVQNGCPACAEHMPGFRRAAAKWAGRVPVHVVDVSSQNPEVHALADRVGVTVTPATAVLRKPTGVVRLDGAASEEDVLGLFELAWAYR